MQEGQPPEEDLNPWGHCMVVWGNLLYEHSQFQAAVGKVCPAAPWPPLSILCYSLNMRVLLWEFAVQALPVPGCCGQGMLACSMSPESSVTILRSVCPSPQHGCSRSCAGSAPWKHCQRLADMGETAAVSLCPCALSWLAPAQQPSIQTNDPQAPTACSCLPAAPDGMLDMLRQAA